MRPFIILVDLVQNLLKILRTNSFFKLIYQCQLAAYGGRPSTAFQLKKDTARHRLCLLTGLGCSLWLPHVGQVLQALHSSILF